MANSVNTNMGALLALRNLNVTNDSLSRTQDRVSTGLRVIGAKDDASSFAIAAGHPRRPQGLPGRRPGARER